MEAANQVSAYIRIFDHISQSDGSLHLLWETLINKHKIDLDLKK